jgi:glycosidase
MQEKIRALLADIYSPQSVEWLVQRIGELNEQHRSERPPFLLSQRDSILITYPDQMRSAEMQPLAALHQFLRSYIGDVISCVHLLPFFPYTSDDGFSVTDYYAVHPDHGDWQDIRDLGRDYRLMFDAVVNHISKSSSWFKGFLNDDESYAHWFIEKEAGADYTPVVRPRTHPLFHTYRSENGNERTVWTTFSEDQVDLNYQEPAVLLQILDLLLFYCRQGASAIRLDAIGFMWKTPGTTCIHLPQTHALIKAMRVVIEESYPGVLLITETNVPHRENVSYFGSGDDEAHLVYNFTLPPLLACSVLTGGCSALLNWARSLKLPDGEICFFNFTASHDGIGLRPVQGILANEELQVLIKSAEKHGGKVSYKTDPDGTTSPYEINCNYFNLLADGCNETEARLRMLLSQAVMLAFPGVPGIYFHSLVGSENDLAGMERTGQNRSINREKLELDTLDQEIAADNSRRAYFIDWFKKLLAIRSMHPAFHPYGVYTITGASTHLVIHRKGSAASETIDCIFNFTDSELQVKMDQKRYLDLISGRHYHHTITLAPYGFTWLKPAIS